MSLLPIASALLILARLARSIFPAGSVSLALRWKLEPDRRPRRRR